MSASTNSTGTNNHVVVNGVEHEGCALAIDQTMTCVVSSLPGLPSPLPPPPPGSVFLRPPAPDPVRPRGLARVDLLVPGLGMRAPVSVDALVVEGPQACPVVVGWDFAHAAGLVVSIQGGYIRCGGADAPRVPWDFAAQEKVPLVVRKACDGGCGKDVDLKKCSACSVAWYCSPQCQRRDWAQHKRLCRATKKGTD